MAKAAPLKACAPKPCSGWKWVRVRISARRPAKSLASSSALAPFEGPMPVSMTSAAEHGLKVGGDLHVAPDRRPEPEVFNDREAGENLTPIRNQRSAGPYDFAAKDAVSRAPADRDAASGLGRDCGDGRQQRAFAGAVRAGSPAISFHRVAKLPQSDFV
jgi:hypothetical protein